MTDVWATFNDLDGHMQSRLADVLETRGATPQQRAMRHAFLKLVPFGEGDRLLEVGCGTGVLTRVLAAWPGIREVVGIDVATALVVRAKELAADLGNVSFQEGDARTLQFDDESFDVVVFDSTLSHVPGPELAVSEAFRVLTPGGVLAVFDGDYATTTVALGQHDPLQTCVDAMMEISVTDRHLVRRLVGLALDQGFTTPLPRSHGLVEIQPAEYMLTIVDRGAEILGTTGRAGPELVDAMKAEARRRVEAGTFYGHIAYGSLIARKPE